MSAEDVANHFQDLEYANGKRCELAAAFISMGPLKAQLLLQAAEHRAAAQALSDAVVRLCGTPNAGDAAAMAHDLKGPGFPLDPADGQAMLESCVDDASLTVAAYRHAIERGGLPHWMLEMLQARLDATRRQAERLSRLGSELALMPTPARLHDDEDPDLSFMDDPFAFELEFDHDGVALAPAAAPSAEAAARRT